MASKSPGKELEEVVEEIGVYPAEAYLFVQQGLSHTVDKVHSSQTDPAASRHVGGRQLCVGLRELALQQWGLLARVVLARWNITTTMDFGRIVFAMVEHDLLQKTDEDTLEDFRGVYNFASAFETDYRIAASVEPERPRRSQRKA